MKALPTLRQICIERGLALLVRITQRHPSRRTLPDHLRTGLDGEHAAYFFLCRNGYTVVARRWSTGGLPGDVDLIAWNGPMLCFVEVKTRTVRDTNPAEITVHEHKRRILRLLARRYLRQLPGQSLPPVRFDVLSVYLLDGEAPEVTHFKGAFGWSEYAQRDRLS